MGRDPLLGLSYRQRHVLAVEGARWEIQAERRLLGRPPGPSRTFHFELELEALAADWHAAIARGRGLERGLIDGVPARLALRKVELHFRSSDDRTEWSGEASFTAVVDEPLAFSRPLDDPAFVDALVKAAALAGALRVQADAIEVDERYWTFPIFNIGMNGVVVERATGRAFAISGSLERATWRWAYEHHLLDEPPGDLVVERVVDEERALAALERFARVRRADLATLPLVLEGCAGWTAAAPLLGAGDALVWRVVARTA